MRILIYLQDYNNSAYTCVGTYAKIIQRLKAIHYHAKFFLVTMPIDNGSEEFNAAIDGIAKKVGDCYVIDLFHHVPD